MARKPKTSTPAEGNPSEEKSAPSGAPPAEPAAGPSPSASLYAQEERVGKVNVAEEIKGSFLDYSMSVIISRALPDVRDGLKPSQRRILYAMHDLSLFPNRQHRKCAKICGDTSGNYHPHGEAVIYPTLVHMAQPWAMRDPLVDGQGNFGSVEGDPPAAMRYTEARMTHLGAILMEDMEQDTVDFVPNYDETRTEPVVFPAAFPNLLVNGATGIAVGMATNIPPHNLGELVDGICAVVDDPKIPLAKLMKLVKGPDFPTGCMVCGLDPIRQYFETGRGSLKVRGRVGVEQLKGGKEQVVITEIPFNVNRATLVEKIAELVNSKVVSDITAIRDESDENTRVVIELKRDAIAKVVINNLYKHTQLETSYSVNMLGIDHGKPKTLPLKDLIACYIEHRREVVLRRARFQLRNAEERAEILEGYLLALANLDEFIRIIRESATREEARVKLLGFEFTRKQIEKLGILIRSPARLTNDRYAFSERQTDAILELRLYQLTGLEREKIQKEYREILARIKDLADILAREARVLAIIKEELQAVKAKHATPRRTELVPDEGEIAIEDLIANEGVIITITHAGLIKRTNISAYRSQRRGGKGVIGMTTREGETPQETDFIEHLFTASTHDYLCFFTTLGRVYVERVHEIPDMGRAAKGRSIANLLELKSEEAVAALIRIPWKKGADDKDETWSDDQFLLMATSKGTVKKTALRDFANIRKGGIIAINIEAGDDLMDVKLTGGHDEVVLITREGMSIRFHEEDARPMGRATFGVRGISLDKKDKVVALAVVDPKATLLVAGENAVGKRTPFDEYRLQSRGGKGIITMKTTDKTGAVVGALTVTDGDEVMLITVKGQMVRTRVKDIRVTGRNTQGVRLVNLEAGDSLQGIARVIADEEEDAEEAGTPAS
ncbi:MAG: DNA gyrase subunit A [Verrucomicrobiae bacterium]|nr:DNA gyrase subunit A [Verrucomicrobiae bacterium]